ncbi:hypothetical protein H8958_000888 [Nasalis larvatus]
MCTTLFLLSTLAMLWRRRFANRVQPEPSDVDGAARGSSVDADPQSSGRLDVCFLRLGMGARFSGPKPLFFYLQ